MSKKVSWAFLLTITAALLLGSSLWIARHSVDAGSWQALAGAPNFYTRTDYEGRTTLGYCGHWWQRVEPLTGGFYNFRRANQQVVGYDAESGSRVTVAAAALSAEDAHATLTYFKDTNRTD